MKKMILFLLVAACLGGNAQQNPPTPPTPPDPPRKEKMESMRIAFLTQKLDLTPEEAQKFWPVYNEFQKKKEALHKTRRDEMMGSKGNIDSLSEKQVEAFVDGEMAFRQKNLDLEKEYHSKFKSVLPIKKVAKLYRAEDMFAHRLLQQISEHGNGEGHGGKRGMPPHPAPPDQQDQH